MQIKKINLRNFKNMESFELLPAKINVLLGPNGSGKTSVIEAIKCGINGKTPADHIKAGEAGGYIVMDVNGLGTIERKWAGGKASAKLNFKATTQKSIVETIAAQFGFSSTTTNIMSSSEVVENMFGRDFSEYLLSFLKNNMDVDKLIALCGASEGANKEMRMYLPAAPDVITLRDIDEAYDYYRDEVSATKKELSIQESKAKFEGAIPSKDVKELEEAIKTTSQEIGGLKSDIENYDKLCKAKKANDEQIAALEKRISTLHATEPSETEKAALDKLIKTLDESIRHYMSETGRMNNEQTRLSDILKRLGEPVCPISKRLVCTTDKSGIQSELKESIANLKKSLADNRALAEKAQSDLAEARKRKTTLEKNETEYNMRRGLEEQLSKAKSSNIKLPPEPNKSKFESLNRRIESLREEQRIAVRYQESVEARKKADELSKRLAIFQEIAVLLSPKGGARKKVLEHNIAPLQTYCNEKMRRILPAYSMNMDVSNGFRVVFADEMGNTISYDALSNGEKIRVIYILTDMLNALNNFRILILDNLDGLDKESLTALTKLVIENKEDYDHIFLVSVNNTEAREILGGISAEDAKIIEF